MSSNGISIKIWYWVGEVFPNICHLMRGKVYIAKVVDQPESKSASRRKSDSNKEDINI